MQFALIQSSATAREHMRPLGVLRAGLIFENGITVVAARGDGNCFFHALALELARITRGKFRYSGLKLRFNYLHTIRSHENTIVEGLTNRQWIETSTGTPFSEYLELMKVATLDNVRTWGGFLEASLIGAHFKLEVHMFEKMDGSSFRLLSSTGKAGGKYPPCCIAWSGNHWDAVMCTEAVLERIAQSKREDQ